MSFMEKQIVQEHFYRITTDCCDEILVPESVCSSEQVPDNPESFAEYCEYGVPVEVESIFGYFCRLSAPGYMDCTQWNGEFETEKEAADYLEVLFAD
jgi:hypothetical protein